MRCFLLLFSNFAIYCSALIVGNPSDPVFFQQGIITSPDSTYSLRTGYITEYIYDALFIDEFDTSLTTRTNATMSNYFGMATFNLFHRWDIYAYVGGSKLNMDEMIETNRTLSWTVGSKATFWQGKVFSIGADVKYFGTNQKPDFLCINGRVRPIVPPFKLECRQFQGALMTAFNTGYFVPYIGGTFLWAKITPTPVPGIIIFPEYNNLQVEFDSEISINHKKFGIVFGTSLVQEEQVSLNVEMRILDEKAINLSGELRF